METYDLSQPLETGTPVYPGDPPVTVDPVATVPGDGYDLRRLELSTHAGTHVDAPAHVVAEGATIDDLQVERFRWSARLVDLAPLAAGAAIDADALAAGFEREFGGTSAPEADLLAVRTGWDRHWGTDRYLEHPHLTPDAADWLAERGLDLGVDAPSPDPTAVDRAEPAGDDADEPYPVHRRLCGDGRLLVENLRGLDRLPDRFDLRAYPLRVRDGDGSPVRAVGVVDRGSTG